MTDTASSKFDNLVQEVDLGGRQPQSKIVLNLMLWVAFFWSLFQLYAASELPNILDTKISEWGWDIGICNSLNFFFNSWAVKGALEFIGGELTYDCTRFSFVMDSTKVRTYHLAFAFFLSFLAFPATKYCSRTKVPWYDWVFLILSVFCTLFIIIWYEDIANNSGNSEFQWIVIAGLGLLCLLEATRRSLGLPLVILALIFLSYTLLSESSWMPELLRIKSKSFEKVMELQWLTTEGVFGKPLEVSASFVFLFVLFGSLLDKAGAGNYFIKLAFSLLGHLRGGPAKAAVLSSGMTGLISGSSIANTVTTGTFTIPLMKRVGFSAEKAGAVEVAASVNGQIMPPVMGAAAFLMVGYLNIPLTQVIQHAFLPAVISYIALLYMVHLEALKANMVGLPKAVKHKWYMRTLFGSITVASAIILAGLINLIFGDSGLKALEQQYDFVAQFYNWIVYALIFVAYVFLVWRASKKANLEIDDAEAPIRNIPETGATAVTGAYYVLPIIVLIWNLMIEQYSPGKSALMATMLMIFIVITHKPLKAAFRRSGRWKIRLKEGISDFFDGMVAGARNMVGIACATAAAGIIVGAVTQSGLGPLLIEIVGNVAGDSIMVLLLLTAVICIILGMGLPTTANYIIVSQLMAGIVVSIGAQNGLIVPLIAVHLFVFYFGIMADVTPPVGLASFAAASISGANPIKTGCVAFMYSLRTAVLPFFFLFNTDLILYGVTSIWDGLFIFAYACFAILILSSGIQGWFLIKNRFYESAALILAAIMIFIPQTAVDKVYPKYVELGKSQFEVGKTLLIKGEGVAESGDLVRFNKELEITSSASLKDNLENIGLEYYQTNASNQDIYEVPFGTIIKGFVPQFDIIVNEVYISQDQPNKYWAYLPAFILIGLVSFLQLLRRRA